ncbi:MULTISPECIES: LysR family transcriptional regulator [unclassified Ensifer]|uniref:LysR family transcriptional regulator n=1 Tax=unclassified Ensifer TaxID=2633371 RepID=UPI000812EC96|nr:MULTISPECIES: LysR family transcriptional regulator [unclassified Ensifer]OCP07512.1 LysR family transcriptional regulator [Ensifer sp. LC11]OCP07619.1 LysR family transcriptional regulator [Ensifer sp. LC14]OCP08287.1 LysR family transcriptional regulator [Ensifer sp. LC13]OCP32008.1 LysR family transcriptional regulator [Ensifer sp. LC499]
MVVSPDWSLYRSFLAVLREGSLSGAGRVLGVSQPTLGRHIAALEEALGHRLFTRSPDGLIPTSAAKMLRPRAEELAAAADALLRAASGLPADDVGTVRIATSEIVAAEVVAPVLAGLQCDHPGIVVELAVSNRLEDLLRRDADIAIRMAQPQQDALLARRIGDVDLGLFAATAYLKTRPAPQSVEELLDAHAIVGFDIPLSYTRTFQLQGRPVTRERFSYRTDSDTGQFAAIRSGCGIGVCHGPLARREGLTPVLPAVFSPKIGMWLCMHEDQKNVPQCRLVFDYLAMGLRSYVNS